MESTIWNATLFLVNLSNSFACSTANDYSSFRLHFLQFVLVITTFAVKAKSRSAIIKVSISMRVLHWITSPEMIHQSQDCNYRSCFLFGTFSHESFFFFWPQVLLSIGHHVNATPTNHTQWKARWKRHDFIRLRVLHANAATTCQVLLSDDHRLCTHDRLSTTLVSPFSTHTDLVKRDHYQPPPILLRPSRNKPRSFTLLCLASCQSVSCFSVNPST